MSKIPNSPLIEVMFELRWGEKQPGNYEFSRDEADLLTGVFSQSIKNKGFPMVEGIKDALQIPGLPKYRFRQDENKWPCFQLGLGLFTANQVGAASTDADQNDEYDWSSFKNAIKKGLVAFDESYPNGLKSLVSPNITLRYQDGFILEENSHFEDFIRNKINADISLSSKFFNHSGISENLSELRMDLWYDSSKPLGKINISLFSAQIKGRRGVVFETSITSRLEEQEKTVDFLMQWAEGAHELQIHSFNTLVSND